MGTTATLILDARVPVYTDVRPYDRTIIVIEASDAGLRAGMPTPTTIIYGENTFVYARTVRNGGDVGAWVYVERDTRRSEIHLLND